jgi:DNA-binding transcriptional MocR family regulator
MEITQNWLMRIGPIELLVLLGDWQHGGGTTSARLTSALRAAIATGVLPTHAVLPPERSFAEHIGCARSTVARAFDDLAAEDLVTRRQGSGTVVKSTGVAPAGGLSQVFGQRLLIDLSVAAPPNARLVYDVAIRPDDLLSTNAAHGYEAGGLLVLRRAVAEWLDADPACVMITNGAHHATRIALSLVAGRGARIAHEDPTYPGAFDVIADIGGRAVPIPRLSTTAPALLQRRLRELSPAAVLVQPRVAAPDGAAVSDSHRRALAAAFDVIGLPIIEDDALGDLSFAIDDPAGEIVDGGSRRTLRHDCRRAPVWTAGSLSKTVWGGLRLGWLVTPTPQRCDDAINSRLGTDLSPPTVSQLMALQLFGDLSARCVMRRERLATAARLLLAELAVNLPDWRPVVPEGGLTIWVDIGADSDRFATVARAHGVAVTPGRAAGRSASAAHHLRLCFDRPAPELTAAVQRLRRAWEVGGFLGGSGGSSGATVHNDV